LLKIKEGDKVLFVQKENGEVVVGNAATTALLNAQESFKGVAEGLNNPDEDEIQSWVDEIRYRKD